MLAVLAQINKWANKKWPGDKLNQELPDYSEKQSDKASA
jgi:hypothetical protein